MHTLFGSIGHRFGGKYLIVGETYRPSLSSPPIGFSIRGSNARAALTVVSVIIDAVRMVSFVNPQSKRTHFIQARKVSDVEFTNALDLELPRFYELLLMCRRDG